MENGNSGMTWLTAEFKLLLRHQDVYVQYVVGYLSSTRDGNCVGPICLYVSGLQVVMESMGINEIS